MSGSTVHNTVSAEVDIGQSLLPSFIPVVVDLIPSILEELIDLRIVGFSFCLYLLLCEPKLFESFLHQVYIFGHIFQLSEAASFLSLVDCRVIGYADKDAQLVFGLVVASCCFLRECLYHQQKIF